MAALFFISAIFSGFTQNGQLSGFGLQPGIVPPTTDPQLLPRRILSTAPYRITPGDAYELVVVLEKTERYPLLLGLDYRLDLPFIGTLNVEGMYFHELRQQIVSGIKSLPPVKFADFLLTTPAFFDVFIYGGVKSPGIATVNPISRISDAILLAGGLVEGARFRQVVLIRDGKSRTMDLSKYTTEAKLDQNPVLEHDDKIYVPQAQKLVEIKGLVRFPGFYEMVHGETLATLILMAGGVVAEGRVSAIQILRQDAAGSTVALQVDLSKAEGTDLRHLDVISVESTGTKGPDRIVIDGALYGGPLQPDKPAEIPQERIVVNIPYAVDLTVLAVLDQLGGPTPLAEFDRSYVQRASGDKIPIMLRPLWENRDLQCDIVLKPGDLVVVPMNPPKVFVAGAVNDAGAYPFSSGNIVSDYIISAGGVDPDSGDPNRIFFLDEVSRRQRVAIDTSVVEPGTVIYVGTNAWTITEKAVTRVLVITAIVSAMVSILADLNETFDWP